MTLGSITLCICHAKINQSLKKNNVLIYSAETSHCIVTKNIYTDVTFTCTTCTTTLAKHFLKVQCVNLTTRCQ